MILSISINSVSKIEVKDGDTVVETAHCFFPDIIRHVMDVVEKYGSDNFSVIALHGIPQFTAKMMPVLKKAFKDTTIIMDGGKL